jgi:hypothetical protein
MNWQEWFEANKKYIHGADVDAWCETAFDAGVKHGAAMLRSQAQEIERLNKAENVNYMQEILHDLDAFKDENDQLRKELAELKLAYSECSRQKNDK